MVRLIDVDTNESLRKPRDGSEYFEVSVPPIGTLIKYYKFNKDDVFKGDYVMYEVTQVVQDLQEVWNGRYVGRFNVYLKKICSIYQ